MKTHITLPTRWASLAKTGIAMVAVSLAGPAITQAVPNPPLNGVNVAEQPSPAATLDNHAKRTPREVRGAPVKPQHYPSNPQPPVPPRP